MSQLAAFNFDEASGNVLDTSGNGHDWTLNTGAQRTAAGGGVNSATGADSATGKGLTKIGAGTATVAATPFGQTTNRTFMFWMKGAGNAVWIWRWYITAPDTGAWGLYLLSGNITLRARKGGTNTNITVAFPSDGLWHHYAGTYDGTNTRLYLDGALVATSGTVTAPLDTADLIDCLETSLTTQTLDDVRIYDDCLTLAQIQALKGTSPPDSTGTTGTLTLALGPVSMAMAATADDPGTLGLALGAPALSLTGQADASASLGIALGAPALAIAGQADASATLGLALSGPSLALDGQADATATLDTPIGPVSLAMAGTADATATLDLGIGPVALSLVDGAPPATTGQLDLAVSGVSLGLSGQADVVGALTLALPPVVLFLSQGGAFRAPLVGPPIQQSGVRVGPGQQVPAVLVGPAQYG